MKTHAVCKKNLKGQRREGLCSVVADEQSVTADSQRKLSGIWTSVGQETKIDGILDSSIKIQNLYLLLDQRWPGKRGHKAKQCAPDSKQTERF